MQKILIVDDDRTIRMSLKRQLENNGYLVASAKSGVEALKCFQEQTPDLVVSDVMMPEMNGFEFCRRLRSTPSGQLVPFIFLSALGEINDRIEGHEIGGDDYLLKPFDPRELVAKIEAQLERSRRIYSEMIRLMQQMAGGKQTVGSPSLNPGSTAMAELIAESNSNPNQALETSEKSHSSPDPLPLTRAEARVFWEVIQGLTNKEIADRLFISPRTVQTHLRHILSKLNLENRVQLIRFAFENGYETPTEGK